MKTAYELDDADIRAIALDCGFKLKPQPDGLEDLNPYVYRFAREILSTVPKKEDVGALRQSLASPAQYTQWWRLVRSYPESEIFACKTCFQSVVIRDDGPPLPDTCPSCNDLPSPTPPINPDNSELRRAAEELIRIFDYIGRLESYYGPCPAIEDLRAALEKS